MLHNEARKLLVQAYEKTHKAKEVAECLSVDVSTVYRIVKRKKETGITDVRTSIRGRKSVLTESDKKRIDRIVQRQQDITIDEIIRKLKVHACNETVRKAVLKLGYVRKKKSLHASEQERSRCEREKK